MTSIYKKDLTDLSIRELVDLCYKCRDEPMDGRDFSMHKQKTLARIILELRERDPHELAEMLVKLLTMPYTMSKVNDETAIHRS